MLGSIRSSASKKIRTPLAGPSQKHVSRRRQPNSSLVAAVEELSLPAGRDCCRRSFSTSRLTPQQLQQTLKSTPLFGSSSSMWDRVFEDVEDLPPVRSEARAGAPEFKKMPRKQTMSAREISAFDDMFAMIFNAVAEQKSTAASVEGDVGIAGIGGQQGSASDIFGTLRKHSKRMRWTKDADVELDRKKEQMGRCETDHELLEWAMREVFAESAQAEVQTTAEDAVAKQTQQAPVLQVQAPSYPHVIALLMSTFRDKYSDPHLALSIFAHAKRLSVPSYVFGCTTAAYNELIATRWACFRDLKGVYDALIEMTINGVDINAHTRRLVEGVRRDIGARARWMDGESMALDKEEVWTMLAKIEEVVRETAPAPTSADGKWDDWKTMDLRDEAGDPHGFNRWDVPASSAQRSPSSSRFPAFASSEVRPRSANFQEFNNNKGRTAKRLRAW